MSFKAGRDNLPELTVETIKSNSDLVSVTAMLGYRQRGIQGKANGYTMLTDESGAVVFQSTAHSTPSNVVINLPCKAGNFLVPVIGTSLNRFANSKTELKSSAEKVDRSSICRWFQPLMN